MPDKSLADSSSMAMGDEALSKQASTADPGQHSTQPGQPAAPGLSRGTKRLAALRRQRRSEWLSDFGGTTAGWRSSQVSRHLEMVFI
jgi:hypothetical protein